MWYPIWISVWIWVSNNSLFGKKKKADFQIEVAVRVVILSHSSLLGIKKCKYIKWMLILLKIFEQAMLSSGLSFSLFSCFHFCFVSSSFYVVLDHKFWRTSLKQLQEYEKFLRGLNQNKSNVATRCHYNKSGGLFCCCFFKDLISLYLNFFSEAVIPSVCCACVLNFPDLQNHSGLLFLL